MTRGFRSASAFAPAHITGFFVIRAHDNPARMGSLGCGVTLESGVTTHVDARDCVHVDAGGSNGAPCPTIGSVVSTLATVPCSIRSTSDVPIGAGFGVSGAGALSTAFALNRALSLGMTTDRLIEIAHVAEVENMTGLGDVVAQSVGGVVVRRNAGASARPERIRTDEKDVFWVVFGKIATEGVLTDENAVDRINSIGKRSLHELLRRPTLENFMNQSKRFAVETGLASDAVADAVCAVEAVGGMASQAIIGDAIFAIDPDGRGGAIRSALSEFGSVGRSRISFRGVRLI